MSDSAEEFAHLQNMHSNAVLLTEGGRPVAFLPSFNFIAAGKPVTMDLLLMPFKHSNYDTRLFFERQIVGRADNWACHRVVDRNWWAPSWNHVATTLPWTAMLCAHLRAVA